MKIKYDTQADAMYIALNDKPFHKNQIVGKGDMVVDLAEDGTVIGIELISPSQFVNNLQEIVYQTNDKDVTLMSSATTRTPIP
jgi:uncharacterized protein YuzE